ncbi:MAG: hypothetical protein C0459_00395 [Chitinophaga sp.]|jgi:hypothetical protein|nr:hypothetical protein [Chitinophaga sp.]
MQKIEIGNQVIVYGTEPMQIPTAAHVRQLTITIPFLFKEKPTVNATISGDGPGGGFVIWNIIIAPTGTSTIIKFSANNIVIGQPDKANYECAYTVIGQKK